MNSQDIKKDSLFCLLYRMGYHAAFTEFKGADLFAITRSKYTHEFEIKISKSDLMSELNCIKELLSGELKKHYPKQYKHKEYLRKKVLIDKNTIPSYFSFIVPDGLHRIALEILKDTPYGLYVYMPNIDPCLRLIKSADYLIREKVSDVVVFNLLRKASTEIQSTRSRLAIKN